MKPDIEIAREADIRPIADIARRLDIPEEQLVPYGHTKAKVKLDYLESLVQTLVEEVCEGGTGLRFFCGDRHGWEFARHDHRKFWRRRRQLGDVCNKTYPE